MRFLQVLTLWTCVPCTCTYVFRNNRPDAKMNFTYNLKQTGNTDKESKFWDPKNSQMHSYIAYDSKVQRKGGRDKTKSGTYLSGVTLSILIIDGW